VSENEKINEEEEYFNNKYESLIEKYGKKLTDLNIVSQSGNHLILKHWKNFSDNVIPQINKDIDMNTQSINYEKINKIDENGNMILFYFINEICKIFKYNDNKITKSNITSLIIDFININYNIFNEEITQYDRDYKRFIYIINSMMYINEIKDNIGETEGIYEEAVDPDKKERTEEEQNAIDDANEEEDALDVEGGEYDYEAGYERNMERPFDDGFVESYEYTYMDYKQNK
jgi:copper chaperone CopZ